ncbi:MAG TPA: NAD(P)H-hydrate dehydratase [Chloroflexota bacterium]|jgi:NAD(P)H-hydrate epimerase
MRVVSVAQMRDLERATFAAGTSEDELQRRAGAAVVQAVLELRPRPARVLALVGTGNNGRDAWIAATGLREHGWGSTLYLCPGHIVSDSEIEEFLNAGGSVVHHQAVLDPLVNALDAAEVVLDGLLGIGAHRAPREPLASLIETLNRERTHRSGLLIVAVDVPSGLDPDSGTATGIVVQADATVVLGGAKRGFLTPRAAVFTGQLLFGEIGVVEGPANAAEVLTEASVRGLLPARPLNAHKGTFGRLLVVAGSQRYVGAAYLVCAAAIRAGVGIATLAAPRWLRDVVASRLAEVTFLPLPDGGPVGEPDESARRILDELPRFTALALGPGLSMEGGASRFVEILLKERPQGGIPAVVDADGINALATFPDWPAWIGRDVVLTPHPGELQRLAGAQDQPATDGWERTRALASQWGVTLVAKDAFTAIGSDGGAWVYPSPNPSLATGGTGDVLTGIIGGLLAQGLKPSEAARIGVWAHGAAGHHLRAGKHAGGAAASDLIPEIADVLALLPAESRRIL